MNTEIHMQLVKTYLLIFLYSSVFAFANNLQAATPIISGENNNGHSIGLNLDILEDKGGEWTITDIISEEISRKFSPSQVQSPGFGYTHSAYWVRFQVINPFNSESKWFLEIEYPYMDYIDLYIPDSTGGFKVKQTGERRPLSSRDIYYRNYVFSMREAPASQQIYYLRFESEDAMLFVLTMWSEIGFYQKSSWDWAITGSLYGILMVMLIYNLFLFLSFREASYGYYTLCITIFTLFFLILDGLAYQYLWPNWTVWANYSLPISIYLSALAAALFTQSFLNTAITAPIWDRRLNTMIGIYLTSSVLFVLTSYYWVTQLLLILITPLVLLFSYIGFLCVLQKSRPARYFLIALSSTFISCILYVSKTLGMFDDNVFFNNSLKIGGTTTMVLFSLGLADRFNLMRDEKEKAQQNAIANLKKADKLKDEFLANTSHELRTPINGIIGIVESLIDGAAGQLSAQVKSNLMLVVTSGQRLSNLVNDILDFAELKHQNIELQIKPVDIRSLTDVVIMLSNPLIKDNNLILVNRIPADVPVVDADENRIQQILHNLIGNAIKFTNQGEVSVTAKILDDKVQISINDSGIGIQQDKLEHIFESFKQADGSTAREYGGTGLGLTITRQLTQLHGSDIQVKSIVGEGSEFSFHLPISEGKIEKVNLVSTLHDLEYVNDNQNAELNDGDIKAQSAKENLTILIVDDEPINLQVLKNQLLDHSYNIVEADSGTLAISLISESSHFDLVLLDIMMPKMSGYEVCQKIRDQYYSANELPIIMLTAKNQVRDLVEGFDMGANDYITKPFSKKELLSRVKSQLQVAKTSHSYSRFVPREFLQHLGKESIIDVTLGNQVRKKMTILFSDIRSFTTISEHMTPEENFNFINDYLKLIGPIIRKHGGFIDKYIGDAIMALFPSEAQESINAAIEMLEQVKVFNKLYADRYSPIAIGIGLHTGFLMLGTVGEDERMEGTVISDAVNLASRIEGLTKIYGAALLVSGDTLSSLDNAHIYHHRYLGKVQVKGKTQPALLYEIFDGLSEQEVENKERTCADFKQGLDLYYERNFLEASVLFGKILEVSTQDKAAKLYFERSSHYLINTPDPDIEFIDRRNE